MTRGISVASANTLLDTQLPTTGLWFQLHTGDPGAAGTTAVSSTTTRVAAPFAAAASAAKALSSAPSWPAWAGTNGESVTDVSVWTASTGGTFKESLQLTASQTMNTGSVLTLNTYNRSITPTAA